MIYMIRIFIIIKQFGIFSFFKQSQYSNRSNINIIQKNRTVNIIVNIQYIKNIRNYQTIRIILNFGTIQLV